MKEIKLNESREGVSRGKRKRLSDLETKGKQRAVKERVRVRKIMYKIAYGNLLCYMLRLKGGGAGDMALWLSGCCSCRDHEFAASTPIR